MLTDGAIRDNNALSFYLREPDKRQETCLAEQSDVFDRQPAKNIRSRGIKFFSMNTYKLFCEIV